MDSYEGDVGSVRNCDWSLDIGELFLKSIDSVCMLGYVYDRDIVTPGVVCNGMPSYLRIAPFVR